MKILKTKKIENVKPKKLHDEFPNRFHSEETKKVMATLERLTKAWFCNYDYIITIIYDSYRRLDMSRGDSMSSAFHMRPAASGLCDIDRV